MKKYKDNVCKTLYFTIICSLAILIINCSSSKKIQIPDDRKNNIPKPEAVEINVYAEYFDKQFAEQAEQSFDFSRQLRNLFRRPKEAMNVDAFGEVANSSWFTNRNAVQQMTIKEITCGPNKCDGPDTSGTWIITRAKMQGVTPGFSIKDKNGCNYLIKFDPIGYSELVSGAEVISTKLFYAAGFNTPENYITYFHPRIIKLGEKVKFTDKKGRKRFMSQVDLEAILARVQIEPNSYIRALASKYISGKILGPFQYKGTRKDDPNDIIPHQHRRELRGLRIISAWLNHFDTKDGNTLDTYVTKNDVSYVQHNLIDFGATFGSASWGPNHRWRGHENDFDPIEILKTVASLGLYVKLHEKLDFVKYPSVGIYDSKYFKPHKYKPQVPNPAFENMTNLDGYWAAKIVMSFTDEQLKAIVHTGQYSNPEAEAILLQRLIERRNKVGAYYYNKVAPLDEFKIDGNNLVFTDLVVKTGLVDENNSEYCYELKCNDISIVNSKKIGNQTSIPLSNIKDEKVNLSADKLQWEVKLKVKRNSENNWSKWIKVYLQSNSNSENMRIVGIKRQG